MYLSGIPLPEVFKYLSLGYPSDPLYLPFISRIENLTFYDSTLFPTIGVLLELLISKNIDFQYVWLMVPILKTLSVMTLLVMFVGEKDLPVIQVLLITLFFIFLFSTNSLIFGDRLSRPHIIPTLSLMSFFFMAQAFKNDRLTLLIVSGGLLGVVLAHDAWLFACIVTGGVIYFLESVGNWRRFVNSVLLFSVGFLFISFLANLKYLYGSPQHELYLEFLGLKSIYNSYNFVFDYYLAIFADNGFLVRFGIAISIGLLCKDKRYLRVMFVGVLFAYLPFLIIGHVVQAYHVIIASKTFVLLCTLLSLSVYFSESHDFKKSNEIVMSVLFIIVMLVNYQSLRSPMVQRASHLYSNYHNIFSRLDSRKLVDPSCVVISNDIFARAYTLAFTDYRLLPGDGLYVSRSMEDIKREISSAMIIGNGMFADPSIFNDEFIRKALHYATHNYFSVSRSFAPNSLKEQGLELQAHQFSASSYEGWQLRYPESLLSSIKNAADDINNYKAENKKFWLIIKNSYQYTDSSDVIVVNNCLE